MTTWTMQDLNSPTPEEEEAWQKMTEEQQQAIQIGKDLANQTLKEIEETQARLDAIPEREDADNEPRSFWNHRVVLMPDDGTGTRWYEIQEVYYNRKGEACGYCNSYVGGETMEELSEQIERHRRALALPILDSATSFNNRWEDDDGKEF